MTLDNDEQCCYWVNIFVRFRLFFVRSPRHPAKRANHGAAGENFGVFVVLINRFGTNKTDKKGEILVFDVKVPIKIHLDLIILTCLWDKIHRILFFSYGFSPYINFFHTVKTVRKHFSYGFLRC